MRVLLLAPQPFYEDRGTPIAVAHVLDVLSRAGAKVDLLTFGVGKPFERPGLRVLRVGRWLPFRRVPVGLSGRKLLFDLLLCLALLRRLAMCRYDCLHAVEEAAFPAALAGRLLGIPVLYDMASSLPKELSRHRWLGGDLVQGALRRSECWLLRNVARTVCSAGLKSHVLAVPQAAPVEEWLFPSEPATASPKEQRRLRQRLSIAESAPVIVYTGTFAKYQGVDLLLDAAARVHERRPDVVFVLVGATPDVAPPASAQQRWVRIVEQQPKRQVALYLTIADILVSPRRGGNNLPSKIFDYLSAGRPIVATDCAAHRVVLDDALATLVPIDAGAMAAAFLRLLDQPAQAQAQASAARSFAETRLSADAFADFLLRNYAACSGREAPAGGAALPRVAHED